MYNLFHHDCAGKVYCVLSRKYVRENTSCSNPYIQQTQLHEKYHLLLHIFYTTPYNSTNDKQQYFHLILYARAQTYYTKSLLIPIVHLYILILLYIRRYFHIHNYIKSCLTPIIHLYILIQSYTRNYLRTGPSPTQENICHNINI